MYASYNALGLYSQSPRISDTKSITQSRTVDDYSRNTRITIVGDLRPTFLFSTSAATFLAVSLQIFTFRTPPVSISKDI